MQEKGQKQAKIAVALAAILLLGLFLRVHGLGKESLWTNEWYSITIARLDVTQIFYEADNNPPLYYILLHYWMGLFGDSEAAIRSLSAVFSVLSIFAIYKLGELIFDRETAIISALLLALSPYHIWYAQEARTYSLLALLTLLSMYFFLRSLERKDAPIRVGYVLSTVLLMYTHRFGLFLVAAQNIYMFIRFRTTKGFYRPHLKKWALLQGTALLMFTPWANMLIARILTLENRGFFRPIPSLGSLLTAFTKYSGSALLLPFLLALVYLAIASDKKNPPDKRDALKTTRSYLLMTWLLTPVLLPFAIAQVFPLPYNTRYTISASLAFYLLIAAGIRSIKNKSLQQAALLMLLFALVISLGYPIKDKKEQWREVARYVDAQAEANDLVLFSGRYANNPVFNYYSKRTDLIKQRFPNKGANEKKVPEIWPLLKGRERVWVILSEAHYPTDVITKILAESYEQSYHGKYAGVEVYLFEKKTG